MAIALVQSNYVAGGPAIIAPATPGNLLVGVCAYRQGAAFGVPAGYTIGPDGFGVTNEGRSMAFFLKTAAGGETSFTAGSANFQNFIAEVSGLTSLAVLASGVTAPVVSTARNCGGSLSPGAASAVIMFGATTAESFTGGGVTPAAGTTELADGQTAGGEKPCLFVGYKIVVAPAGVSQLVSGTGPDNAAWNGQSLMFGLLSGARSQGVIV